jgi:hypothetical protein
MLIMDGRIAASFLNTHGGIDIALNSLDSACRQALIPAYPAAGIFWRAMASIAKRPTHCVLRKGDGTEIYPSIWEGIRCESGVVASP